MHRGVVLMLLALSACALAAAPAFMPIGYSWLAHTTSESAAQGVPFAWMARAGFLLFGWAVLLLCTPSRSPLSPAARWLLALFGAAMTAAAAFSHRPWDGAPFDPLEDALHSWAATGMGFALVAGVIARLLQRMRTHAKGRTLDVMLVLVSTFVPLAMLALPAHEGLLQRGMFLLAYIWFAREAWMLPATEPPASPATSP